MPRTKAKPKVEENESALEDVNLDEVEESPLVESLLDVTDTTELSDDEKFVPTMCDPEWSDYVLSHLTENEKNDKGQPWVPGLRRVARLLLGPILYSGAKVVEPARYLTSSHIVDASDKLDVATVEYEITFLCSQDTRGTNGAYRVTYRDCGECYARNTDEPFRRYPSATAATKAEGRCLRKALQLRGVICAEEASEYVEENNNGKILGTQKTFIYAICNRNGIDVMKYINGGKQKYDSLDDVSEETAKQMTKHLSELQRTGSIPEKFLK